MCGIHFCCNNNSGFKPVLSLVQMLMGKQNRMRFRTHFGMLNSTLDKSCLHQLILIPLSIASPNSGTDIEAQYSLMTFGISLADLPVIQDESARIASYQRRIQGQLQKDVERKDKEARKAQGLIPSPTPNDVLLGRGRPYHDFPGNVALGKLVDANRDRYQSATEHLEKICISTNIVRMMQENGTRFLKRKANVGWEVVADSLVLDRVGRSLRSKVQPKASLTTTLIPRHPFGVKRPRYGVEEY